MCKTFWITKYALSNGVFARELEVGSGYSDGYASSPSSHEKACDEERYFLKIGRDCFESREDALKAAEQMRLKKISALKKQIEKLENKVFS